MRSRAEVEAILRQQAEGANHSRIAASLGIPRATVRDICRRHAERAPVTQPAEVTDLKSVQCEFESHREHYAFLLGFYLGDGYLDRTSRTYRLRLFSHSKDELLITKLEQSLRVLFPRNRVGRVHSTGCKCLAVYLYSNTLPSFFPLTGGRKHRSSFILADWQIEIVHRYPRQFVSGLMASDGSRLDISYPRYEFVNCSRYIADLLCAALDQIGISYVRRTRSMAESERRSPKEVVVIARRESVALLDTFVAQRGLSDLRQAVTSAGVAQRWSAPAVVNSCAEP